MLREINAATELLKVRIESSRYKSINQFTVNTKPGTIINYSFFLLKTMEGM